MASINMKTMLISMEGQTFIGYKMFEELLVIKCCGHLKFQSRHNCFERLWPSYLLVYDG